MSFTREERDRAALGHGALTCVRQTTAARRVMTPRAARPAAPAAARVTRDGPHRHTTHISHKCEQYNIYIYSLTSIQYTAYGN